MKLVLPSSRYEESFLQASAELRATERKYTDEAMIDSHEKFIDYIDRLLKNRSGKRLRAGYVPSTEWWLIDHDSYIGRIGLRHDLTNDYLREIGGHIGYMIRPSARRKGYGTRILSMGLKKFKQLGYADLIITCDETNDGSRKIIEKNGGVFLRNTIDPKTELVKQIYSIKTH